jgi:hypothetical protein
MEFFKLGKISPPKMEKIVRGAIFDNFFQVIREI